MHYLTGREDLDAPRFCRLQFNPPEGYRATITIALSFNYMSSNYNVEPSILSSKFIVVNEKAILSARMAKIRTIYPDFGDRRRRIRLFFGDDVIYEGKCSLAVSII